MINPTKISKPKAIHALGLHHWILAMQKGFVWGWFLSVCIGFADAGIQGQTVANQHIIEHIQNEHTWIVEHSNAFVLKQIQSAKQSVKIFFHLPTLLPCDFSNLGFFAAVINGFQDLLNTIKAKTQAIWQILQSTTTLSLQKWLISLLALPLLTLTWALAISDGVMRRAIRAANKARESSFIFHRLIAWIPKLIVLGTILYVVLPISGMWFLLLLNTALFYLTAQTIGGFKKYV